MFRKEGRDICSRCKELELASTYKGVPSRAKMKGGVEGVQLDLLCRVQNLKLRLDVAGGTIDR